MPLLFAHVEGPLPNCHNRIVVKRPAVRGLEENLYLLLVRATRETGVTIRVNSIDTGKHAPKSRHYRGAAVDIDVVNGRPATLANLDAARFWRWLKREGFRSGEREPWSSVLWGPVRSPGNPTAYPHNSHLHVSLGRAALQARSK